ncbi:hypothetical protein H4582DRAFT_1965268 [Lactarius indigo]|nr:hypothetical protein H4582DRAFT_1965268 [Lactarius indigo]
MLQEIRLLHDGVNATQLLQYPEHPGDAPQFLPPEVAKYKYADLATAVEVIEAPGGNNGGASHRCERAGCGKKFKRRQELKRHRNQVHKPQRICPFKLCAYKWKRPDKIRTHIIEVHGSELCPEVLQKLKALRGNPKGVVDFVDTDEFLRNFEPPAETYVLPSVPPPGPSEEFRLRDFCDCKREV